ncbi:MAG: methionyl-tRNA formyltransferase [Flavobacteriaceae bacterium]|nr:methionyl-tRNA formyltransferase [Flavobacteriaceae bacterium]
MRDLRIVFMGTPDFAVGTLKALLDNHFNIVAVITAPDRPAGRGRKLNQSAVKKFALEHQLKVLQPTNLKNEEFLSELKSLHANLQIVVAFRMLPKAVWQQPEYGTFNLHASLLPEYRGAAPINWAIINGEKKTGVTTFFIDEKIDTGEIILQKEVKIKKHDTAGDLHDRLMEVGSKLVIKTVEKIQEGPVITQKQPDKELKAAPKLFKETCRIDWGDSRKNIYNHIRGLSPYPSAWTILQNGDQQIELKIYSAAKQKEVHNYPLGTLVPTKKELKVAVKKGFILLLEIQLSGKRKMAVSDFLNGFSFDENAKVL